MPINNRREPSLKDFGWLVLVMIGVLSVWFNLAGRHDKRFEDRVDINRGEQAAMQSTEQSLDALESSLSASAGAELGAAGQPIRKLDSSSASPLVPPVSSVEAVPIQTSLADELSALAKSKTAGGSGSGSPAGKSGAKGSVRTGSSAYAPPFTPPRASFGALGASESGGGSGGSGAGYSVSNDGFFNTSKANPSRVTTSASLGGDASERTANMLEGLKNMEGKTAQSLATANNDAAAGYNAQAFDLASKKDPTLNLGGAGAALVNEGGAVKDLKALMEAKKKIDQKDPNIDKIKDKAKKDAEKEKEKKNNPFSAENMSQQIMMMMVTTAIGGVMGPIAMGIGGAMSVAMGMPQQPMYPAGYGYGNYGTAR